MSENHSLSHREIISINAIYINVHLANSSYVSQELVRTEIRFYSPRERFTFIHSNKTSYRRSTTTIPVFIRQRSYINSFQFTYRSQRNLNPYAIQLSYLLYECARISYILMVSIYLSLRILIYETYHSQYQKCRSNIGYAKLSSEETLKRTEYGGILFSKILFIITSSGSLCELAHTSGLCCNIIVR